MDLKSNLDHIDQHNLVDRITKAVAMITQHAAIDGAHHKDWVLDQVTRILTKDDYDAVVADAKSGADGPETYSWETGIAP